MNAFEKLAAAGALVGILGGCDSPEESATIRRQQEADALVACENRAHDPENEILQTTDEAYYVKGCGLGGVTDQADVAILKKGFEAQHPNLEITLIVPNVWSGNTWGYTFFTKKKY